VRLSGLFYLLVGIVLLSTGANIAVSGAAKLARALGVDKYGIGATIVATITSLPELAVASIAVVKGEPDIAIGAAFGSTLGLILLSLGVLGIITKIRFDRTRKREVLWATIIITWVTAVAVSVRSIGPAMGAILLGLYFAYMRMVGQGGFTETAEEKSRVGGAIKGVALVVVGIVAVITGAGFVVEGGKTIARSFGIPEFFVAVFVVGLGTNLPELAVSVGAALKGHTQIAVGNILGSAVANLTLVLGTAAVIGGLTGKNVVFNSTAHLVAGLMLSVTLVGAKLSRDEEVSRGEAAALVALYVLLVCAELLLSST